MCGIIGYVGQEDAVPLLLSGLRRLEYRGYDSAGLAVLEAGTIEVRRSVGKLGNLERVVQDRRLSGSIGIGHTRWATHGKPSDQNAHPHRSGNCVLVHNGIIENYLPLKQQLEKEGYRFESETDTEVVAHLIRREVAQGKGLAEAVFAATRQVRGSYAIAAICEQEPDLLVAARFGCPLVVGRFPGGTLAASDVTAMLDHTREVTYLEEGDVAVITAGEVRIMDFLGQPVHRAVTQVSWDAAAVEKGGYPHFMLKEIHEQPQAILDTMRGRYSFETGQADLPDVGLTR